MSVPSVMLDVEEILDGLQEVIGLEVAKMRDVLREGLPVKGVELRVAKLTGALAETVRTRFLLIQGEDTRELTDDELRDQLLSHPSVKRLVETIPTN